MKRRLSNAIRGPSTIIEKYNQSFKTNIEQGSKVLFRVSLAILHMDEKNLLAARDMGSLMEEIKGFLQGKHALECHSFMETVYSSTQYLKVNQV